jgi:hypothetical protein
MLRRADVDLEVVVVVMGIRRQGTILAEMQRIFRSIGICSASASSLISFADTATPGMLALSLR